MKTSKLIFAAVFAGAMLASCAPKELEENVIPAPAPEAVAQPGFISISATKGLDSKALSMDGTKLVATWEEGEKVAVYKNSNKQVKLGTLSPITFGSKDTKLEGDIDISDLAKDDELFLVYPDRGWYYYGQDGTLATISSNYDFATATVSVTAVDAGHLSASSAAFENQQAIVKFNLKDKATGNALAVPDFVIVSANQKLVQSHNLLLEPEPGDNLSIKLSPDEPLSEITLAVATEAGEADDYAFIGTTFSSSGDTYYEVFKAGATFEKGKYYAGNLNMNQVTYTVAGSPASVFGTAWAADLADNDMEFNGSEFCKVFNNIPANTVMELKVVRNHDWGTAGVDNYPAKNLIVTAWAEGDLYVGYNPAKRTVNARMMYSGTEPTIPDVYTIAFAPEFDIITPANDLTDNGDGTYSYSTVLDTGEYNFAIYKNRAYDVAWWPYESPYYVNVTEKSTLDVTFTPASNKIETSLTPYVPPTPPLWSVVGQFNNWGDPSESPTDIDMVENSEGKWVSPEIAMNGLFKIRNNHKWSESRGYATENFVVTPGTAFAVVDPGQNVSLTEYANYIITYDPVAETILVTKTTTPVTDVYTVVGESDHFDVFGTPTWDLYNTANDMVQESGNYVKTYTNVAEFVNLKFKVVKNRSWDNAYGDPDNTYDSGNYHYQLPATGDVKIIFDPSTTSITVEGPEEPYDVYILGDNIAALDGSSAWGENRMLYVADNGYSYVGRFASYGGIEYSWFRLDLDVKGVTTDLYFKSVDSATPPHDTGYEIKIPSVTFSTTQKKYYFRTDGIRLIPITDEFNPETIVDSPRIWVLTNSESGLPAKYVHMWGGDSDTSWPGIELTKTDSKYGGNFWYYVDIIPNTKHFIIDAGNGQWQTADLDLADSTKSVYYYSYTSSNTGTIAF